MSTAGYIQEGKQRKRNRGAFGCLVVVALLFLVLVATAAGLTVWYLMTHRDSDVYMTIFNDVDTNTVRDGGEPLVEDVQPGFERDDERTRNGESIQQRTTFKDEDVLKTKTNAKLRVTAPMTTKHTTNTKTTTTPTPSTADTTYTHTSGMDAHALSEAMGELWEASMDNYLKAGEDYALHFQGRTTYRDTTDRAPRKLFQKIRNMGHSEVMKKFIRLLDNYDQHLGNVEAVSERHLVERNQFIDAVLETRTLGALQRIVRRIYPGLSESDFRALLETLWFKVVQGQSSSPFERLFVGERNDTHVLGLNSWMQFYLQERDKRLDYQGYIQKQEIGLLEVRFKWNEAMKTSSVFLVGISADLEIAMYTLCHIVHPQEVCSFQLNGQSINIRTEVTSDYSDFGIITSLS